MFLANSPSGSKTPRVTNTTWQANSPTGAPTHVIATYKPACPTAKQGVAGQTFVPRCVSGSVSKTRAGFQGNCPTSEKTP